MLLHGSHVRWQIATVEQSTMHDGVQCLDASVEHLRESRDLTDVAHRESGAAQRGGGATGGDQFPVARNEFTSEIDESGFV